jgi:hypothetical protein
MAPAYYLIGVSAIAFLLALYLSIRGKRA